MRTQRHSIEESSEFWQPALLLSPNILYVDSKRLFPNSEYGSAVAATICVDLSSLVMAQDASLHEIAGLHAGMILAERFSLFGEETLSLQIVATDLEK